MNELETVELIDHSNVIKLLAYNLNVDDNGTMLLHNSMHATRGKYHVVATTYVIWYLFPLILVL